MSKIYRVDLSTFGTNKKTFNVRGQMITIEDGALLLEGHKIVQMFPQYCTLTEGGDVTESKPTETKELLVEEPLETATVEEEIVEEIVSDSETVIEEETVEEKSLETLLDECETREDVEEFIKANDLDVKLGRAKDIDKVKAIVLKVI